MPKAKVERGFTKGFTLVEMAIVLLIIGLVILTVYPAMQAFRAAAQRSETNEHLQALLRATAAYVQAAGCVPCPTPAQTVGAGFGRVRGDTDSAACGSCDVYEGIPPYASLGIGEAIAHDGWGRWITMRVDPALTQAFGVVPPTTPCTSSDVSTGLCAVVGASQKGLCKTGLDTANRIAVKTPSGASQQAAVVFVSHGGNGRGAFIASSAPSDLSGARYPFPSSEATCANGGYERCNADGNATFVNATPTISVTTPYDDSLASLDRNALVSWLGSGACQTTW